MGRSAFWTQALAALLASCGGGAAEGGDCFGDGGGIDAGGEECAEGDAGAGDLCDCAYLCLHCDEAEVQAECGADAFDYCECRSMWEASCACAGSAEACAAASAGLPGSDLCTGGDDGWHGCRWISSIETCANSGCAYGEVRSFCAYMSGGDPGPWPEPPCGGQGDETSVAFSYELGGSTYTGWAPYHFEAPADLDLSSCDPVHGDPPVCGCVCDDDYPLAP